MLSVDHVYPSLLSIKMSGIEKQVTIWYSKIKSQYVKILKDFDVDKDASVLNNIMDGVYRFKNNKKHRIIKIYTKDMTKDKLAEKVIE